MPRVTAPLATGIVGIVIGPALVGQAITSEQPAVAPPALVGQAATGEQPPEEPKPVAAELTANLQAEEKKPAETAYLRIRAKGPAPRPGTLVDSNGLSPVTVGRAPAAACDDLPLHRALTRGSDAEWCLRLSGIGDGVEVKGALEGKDTTLTLTATRRSDFWWGLPLLWSVIGLLAGLGATQFVRWVQKGLRRAQLRELQRRNNNATPDKKIVNLDDWLNRQEGSKEPEDLLTTAAKMVHLATRGVAARVRLQVALTGTTLPSTFAYLSDAGRLANLAAPLETDDFLDEDEVLDHHPAYYWLLGLDELTACWEDLKTQRQRIHDQVADDCQPDLVKACDKAEADFRAAKRPAAVEGLTAKVDEVRAAIELKLEDEKCWKPGADRERRWLMIRTRARDVDLALGEDAGAGPTTASAPPPPTPSGGSLTKYKILIGVMSLVIFFWALLALEQTVYEDKLAFGSTADYVALVIAAIGAGAGGGVLSLVGMWDPLKAKSSEE